MQIFYKIAKFLFIFTITSKRPTEFFPSGLATSITHERNAILAKNSEQDRVQTQFLVANRVFTHNN